MTTVTRNAFDLTPAATTKVTINPFAKVLEHYLAYAEKQGKTRIIWYCKTLLVLPCAFMMPLALLMALLTPAFHTYYIGLLIMLLFTNVVIHVAQFSGRVFVPVYHATIAVMLLIPTITYLLV